MIFTSAISFLIFIVVGFMSVIIGSGEDDRSGLTLLIVNGFRWGGITFIIGIAISVFTAFSSYWEKGTHKKNLLLN